MQSSARGVVELYPRDGFDPRLLGVRGTIRFDVADVGSWCVHIDDGYTSIVAGHARADLTVYCGESDFVGLLAGDESLLCAYLRGDVEIEGDRTLGLRFHGLATQSPAAQHGSHP